MPFVETNTNVYQMTFGKFVATISFPTREIRVDAGKYWLLYRLPDLAYRKDIDAQNNTLTITHNVASPIFEFEYKWGRNTARDLAGKVISTSDKHDVLKSKITLIRRPPTNIITYYVDAHPAISYHLEHNKDELDDPMVEYNYGAVNIYFDGPGPMGARKIMQIDPMLAVDAMADKSVCVWDIKGHDMMLIADDAWLQSATYPVVIS